MDGDALLRSRLLSEELGLLYASARSEYLSNDSVRRVFGVIEAVESAANLDDLVALTSLRTVVVGNDSISFTIDARTILAARSEFDENGRQMIAFVGLERSVDG